MLRTITILFFLSALMLVLGAMDVPALAADDAKGEPPSNPDLNGKLGLFASDSSLNIYWDSYHDTDGDSLSGNYSTFYSELTTAGHTVVDKNVVITIAELAAFDVLVIADPETAFDPQEITDINTWVAGAGSLFMMGEWSGAFNQASVNDLLLPYGIQFIGDSSGDFADSFNPHPVTVGVSTLELAGAGLEGGGIELGYSDLGELILSAYDASGKVAVIADSNTVMDGYIGTYDEIMFLHNVIEWLGEGVEPLTADSDKLDWQGDIILFSLNAGPDNGDRDYILLGSVSGTSPGILLPGGAATLPLNPDYFMGYLVANLNTSLFQQFLGTLDPVGHGEAMLDSTELSHVSRHCLGVTLNFAYALSDPWDFASNNVEVEVSY